MDLKGENIDKFFREGLKNFEATPPPEVWDNILQANSDKKKRILPVFRYVAAAVAILLIAGSVFTLVYLPRSEEPVADKSTNEESIVKENITKDTELSSENINKPNKEDDQSVEKDLQKSITPEKPLVAQIEKKVAIDKTENISSGNVSKANIIINAKDETAEALITEDYEALALIDNPLPYTELNKTELKTIYFSKEALLIHEFANSPIDQEKKYEENWSFGAKFSPLYTSRNITSSMPGNFKEMYDNVENGIIAFSGGFNFKYQPAGRISIHIGLFYSKMGQRINDLLAYDVPESISSKFPAKPGGNKIWLNSSFGTLQSSQTSLYIEDITVARVQNAWSIDYFDPVKFEIEGFDAEITQNFEYIEIPLLVSYKLIDRVIDFQLLGGVSTNVLVNNEVFANLEGQIINLGKTRDIYKLNYSSVIGLGIEYGFSNQLSLSIEPTFKYFLNSFSSSNELNVHPFSIGLFSGVSYKF